MSRLFPVIFWLVWVGLPTLWVGRRQQSWVRGLTVAAMVVIAPFGLTLALTVCGSPADWADTAATDAWVTRCANVGVPAGYLLGILLPLAAFRYRDRGSRPPRELRSLLRNHGHAARIAVKQCAGHSPPAGA